MASYFLGGFPMMFCTKKECLLDSAENRQVQQVLHGHEDNVVMAPWLLHCFIVSWLRGPIFFAHVCVRCVFFPKKKTGGKGTKYLESRWCCIFLVQLLLAGGLDSESEKRN